MVFRPLRHSDFSSYFDTLRLGIGKLERSTGLDESAEATVQSLSRWSIWAILRLLKLIGRPVADVFVASDGRSVAGTGTILWLRETAYVAGMATRPEFRGQGVASRILGLLQAEAVRRRRPWLALDVESENEIARRVYRRAGYRDVVEFGWHTRDGVPPTTGPVSSETRVASNEELTEFARKLDAVASPDYRGPFPSAPRMLSHNELLLRGAKVRHRAWILRTVGGSSAALRAYFLPGAHLAAYLPLPVPPEPSSEEYRSLFDAATEWLRPFGPRRSTAIVREPVGSVGPPLLRLGFTPVVASMLMVREVPQ